MTTHPSRVCRIATGLTLAVVVLLIATVAVPRGCAPMSIREESKSAGFNGSFEIERSGLPVNWSIHYPPLKNKDVEVSLDPAHAADGNQSMKLTVHRVAGDGWRSPGLFQVVPASALHTYKLTFWLKGQAGEASVFVRSENPKVSPPPVKRRIRSEELDPNTWRQFECLYTVPDGYQNIRFELDIVRPGVIWIDDVRIQEMQDE